MLRNEDKQDDLGQGCELRLAHFLRNGRTRIGLVNSQNNTITDLSNVHSLSSVIRNAKSIDEILSVQLLGDLQNHFSKLSGNEQGALALDSVKLQSPILNPQKIFLAALNYISHSKEQGVKPPEAPYFFTKFRNSIIGPDEPILVPMVSKKADWEVELAVVIGKRGKYITKNDAMDYVAGYTVANDISFRDLQFDEDLVQKPKHLGTNWVKGKGLDSSFPLGPWLVTSDELVDPYNLEISLTVNGALRQRSVTGEMVFKIDSLIECLSSGITLEPGDIISTGTPLGVAIFSGVPYLKEGDILESRIEEIGTLRNPVVAER